MQRGSRAGAAGDTRTACLCSWQGLRGLAEHARVGMAIGAGVSRVLTAAGTRRPLRGRGCRRAGGIPDCDTFGIPLHLLLLLYLWPRAAAADIALLPARAGKWAADADAATHALRLSTQTARANAPAGTAASSHGLRRSGPCNSV